MTDNTNYIIYERMLEACKHATVSEDMKFSCTTEDNMNLLAIAAKLAKRSPDNPLHPGQPGYNEFDDVLYFYNMWPDGKPDCALKKRFLIAVYKLCQLHPENIFAEPEPKIEVSLESMQEKEHKEAIAEDKNTGTYVEVEPPEQVFGVLPFEGEENFGFESDEDDVKAELELRSWRKNPFKKG